AKSIREKTKSPQGTRWRAPKSSRVKTQEKKRACDNPFRSATDRRTGGLRNRSDFMLRPTATYSKLVREHARGRKCAVGGMGEGSKTKSGGPMQVGPPLCVGFDF